ncbi:5-oxoprolinase [Histoplasma ohiense]|nr:5-oxoprolinase [Histoplasma ohiense (nom. inval.)]
MTGYRLGVDVGGTFTDVCVFTPNGETVRAKVPSTVHDQSIGVKDGIAKVREILQSRSGWDGKFDFIHHGTTTATNAVLEGKGAKHSALIVTAGHKDILALRRSHIPGALGAWINFVPPEPVVPLERTVQCSERVSATGELIQEVDARKLRLDLAELKHQVPESVTISLINSYANRINEDAVRGIVREELGPEVEIVCSTDVLPETGEYERTVTAAANAMVKPIVKRYLSGLQNLLKDDSSIIRVLKSDGAMTSLELAGDVPVNCLMSGPAGGVRGIADVVAKNTPFKNLITLDIGGTSTDVAIIVDGSPSVRRETVIDNLTVRAPSVDVRSVGAGGGSIARYVDITSTLRVGPESAGATPGPACYGAGGKDPTVSDANLILGYLPSKLLGGSFELDVAAAEAAIDGLAAQMNLPREKTAEGIISMINETIYGAVRLVSVERGHDPRGFALVAYGGAGPMHANAVGKLLGAWPVIVPPAPGVLCAQGDATTKMSHALSRSYIKSLSDIDADELQKVYSDLEQSCVQVMISQIHDLSEDRLIKNYEIDVRYKGQSLTLTIPLSYDDTRASSKLFSEILHSKFDALHDQQFKYSLPSFELEVMRLGVIVIDGAADIEIALAEANEVSEGNTPPQSALREKSMIIFEGKQYEAHIWDRSKITKKGYVVEGPCVVTEMDSNTLILPGYYGEIDSMGNILIRPLETKKEDDRNPTSHTPQSATELVAKEPLISTLISASLQSIREEMDRLMLRCAMSPAIRDQQDEFNVVTNPKGEMLVGQFGSFVPSFLRRWTGTIEEGDVFMTNDVYEVDGAISHLNDVIVLLPIFYAGKLVGWAANFGHLTDVQGKVPGSMSVNATTVFEDGIQIPLLKLYRKGQYNEDIMTLLCRNSRQPDWMRSDITALVTAVRTAAERVCELHDRYGAEVYKAACDSLLEQNRSAISKIIDTKLGSDPTEFTDFVDDDGHGYGPYAVKCTMQKKEDGKLHFDWHGTSPQSETGINFYLSETMFKMFIGYYLLAAYDPYCVVNDGFHDLLEIHLHEGSVLKPVRPAPLSCRTHFLGRILDVLQALFGQRNPTFMAAAGFSDSPHFFYSGFKPSGEWFQLYQIGFGGVPARPIGDGPDCHCLFPAMKSIPTESLEFNYPLRLEANESVADSGGAGFYRGGNAQRTVYRFLSAGEFSIHDDRWFTKPWGVNGGKPGSRSRKVIYYYSKDPQNPPTKVLQSKCDHIRVAPGDLLEWITWGGGGLGDPLTRPVEKVALEVHRKSVTFEGARKNYGVVVNPSDYSVDQSATDALRAEIKAARASDKLELFDRGGTLAELRASCLEETGLSPPIPQWDKDPYGPHVAVPYVKDWFKLMREKGEWVGL